MDMSLSDCFKFLATRLQEDGYIIPPINSKLWHQIFYKFKTSSDFLEKPNFVKDLFFEWD